MCAFCRILTWRCICIGERMEIQIRRDIRVIEHQLMTKCVCVSICESHMLRNRLKGALPLTCPVFFRNHSQKLSRVQTSNQLATKPITKKNYHFVVAIHRPISYHRWYQNIQHFHSSNQISIELFFALINYTHCFASVCAHSYAQFSAYGELFGNSNGIRFACNCWQDSLINQFIQLFSTHWIMFSNAFLVFIDDLIGINKMRQMHTRSPIKINNLHVKENTFQNEPENSRISSGIIKFSAFFMGKNIRNQFAIAKQNKKVCRNFNRRDDCLSEFEMSVSN